jgi:hypothetical protein
MSCVNPSVLQGSDLRRWQPAATTRGSNCQQGWATMAQNELKRRWKEGKAAVNGWLAIPSAFVAEVMAQCGWDSVTVDLQHGVQDWGSNGMPSTIERRRHTPSLLREKCGPMDVFS